MQRRLVAIVAADIAGYSRLVGQDEEGTLATMRVLRSEVIDPLLAEYGGRVANTAGDSLLIEFPSAVEAIRCAVAVQEEMSARTADVPEDRRILFRVGVNVGDVVAEGDDLLGDGVNVAARLEGLAPPGGIVMSGTAFDQVMGKLDTQIHEIGEVEVKNIELPIRAYQVMGKGDVAIAAPTTAIPKVFIAAAAALLIAIGGVAVWQFGNLGGEQEGPAFDIDAVLAMPDGPTVAVMPLKNLGEDSNHQRFADGLSEELIGVLGRYTDLNVLSSLLTFGMRNNENALVELREKYGINYLVSGSLRRTDTDIRLVINLIDATTGIQTWAETFDMALRPSELFAAQNTIVEEVAKAVGDPVGGGVAQSVLPNLRHTPPENMSTYECTLYTVGDWVNYDRLVEMRDCVALAKTEDRADDRIYATDAMLLRLARTQDVPLYEESKDKLLEMQAEAVDKALKLNPRNAQAMFHLALTHLGYGDRKALIKAALDTLALKANANVSGWTAWLLANVHEFEIGLPLLEQAIEISKGAYPRIWHAPFGNYHIENGRYEEALIAYRTANADGHWSTQIQVIQALGLLGRIEEAKQELQKLDNSVPGWTIAKAVYHWNYWMPSELSLERLVEGLRLAGMPEGDFDGL